MPQLQHPSSISFVVNKSQYVPAASGQSTTIFTTASRGPVNVPVSITNGNELDTVFGLPDYAKHTYGLYAAKQVLTETNQLWVVRVEATSVNGGIVVPTKGIISVEDVTAGTAKQIFVATAKSEGEWINTADINLTAFSTQYNASKGDWTATTSYTKGNTVTPTVANGLTMQAITTGTSASAEPTWPTVANGTVIDGGITWKAITPITKASFTVSLDGITVLESFSNIDISQIAAVKSDYFDFTIGTGSGLWAAPGLPKQYLTSSANSSLGADNINEATNPYITDAVVAGWISSSINAGTFNDENLYPTAILIAPGYCNSGTVETRAVWNDLVALARKRGDCIVIPEISKGLNAAAAITERATIGTPDDEQFSADPYYPWLKESDPTLRQPIELPPSGYVAAVYHYNDRVGEIWTAPAGLERGVVRGPEGIETGAQIDSGSQDILFPGGINVITFDPALRVLYINGQLTATFLPSKMDRVHVARLVTSLQKSINRYVQSFRFRPNDAETWNEIAGGVRAFLADYQARRGLEAFKVVCDATTNTPARRDRNELWLELHIVPTGDAEFIYVPIVVHRSGQLQ